MGFHTLSWRYLYPDIASGIRGRPPPPCTQSRSNRLLLRSIATAPLPRGTICPGAVTNLRDLSALSPGGGGQQRVGSQRVESLPKESPRHHYPAHSFLGERVRVVRLDDLRVLRRPSAARGGRAGNHVVHAGGVVLGGLHLEARCDERRLVEQVDHGLPLLVGLPRGALGDEGLDDRGARVDLEDLLSLHELEAAIVAHCLRLHDALHVGTPTSLGGRHGAWWGAEPARNHHGL